MSMTTKLVTLLTILFVFFKFGEPAKVMMSIYGDKGFLFHSKALGTSDIVGFVYEDSNGAFNVVNCSATTTTTYFKLKTDCTVVPAAAVTVIESTSTLDEGKAAALKLQTEANFPEADVNTNMMVAPPTTTEPAIAIGTATTLAGTSKLVTILPAVPSSTTNVAAADAESKFLCNHLSDSTSGELFAVDETTDGSTFGQVKAVSDQSYLPIMKCVGLLQNVAASPTRIALAAFMLIVSNHADLTGSFNFLAFPSVVLLPQSINQTTATTTVVGYINGLGKCPTGNNVTFVSSTTSTTTCKGTISINTKGNYSFSFNGTKYYLPVMDASGAITFPTTCPATSTTTCEDFAFNFKYSNTFIGMLLIFMLKMLQSY